MSECCAWCDKPKQSGPICPDCGADYAKAEAIKKHGKAVIPEIEMSPLNSQEELNASVESVELVKDPHLEKKLCLLAFPLMLAGAWLVQITGIFASLQRITFGMPIHELGHATVSWFSGYNAIPTFWKTITASTQGFLCPSLVFIGIGLIANYGRKTRQLMWIVLALVLWGLQFVGTFMLENNTVQMLIIFGGDAMGMVLATVVMSTFYLGKNTQLYKGAVRWGLVFIGAAAFMDMFMSWWRGQYDISSIGYGTTGGMYTDAYLLINQYRWGWDEMISRHLTVAYACMLAQLIMYGFGIRQANQWIAEKKVRDRKAKLAQLSEKPETI